MTMRKPEKEANAILKQFKIVKPPVPVDKIASKLGAKLSYAPFQGDDDISGILIREKGKTIIGINSAHPNTRQRFSIAHEIGHLVLHNREIFVDKVVRVTFRDKKSSLAINSEEIDANQFAAELLMPRNLLKTELERIVQKKNNYWDKDDLIDNLADTFDVSSQAMAFRLNNLGIIVNI